MAAEGAKVGIIGRYADTVNGAAEAVRHAGGEAMGVTADVTRRGDVGTAFAQVRETFGPPDILVTAAGMWTSRSILDLTDEDWDSMMAVHVRGTLYCMQAAIPDMIAAGRGRIITVTSPAATVGGGGKTLHYAAAKGSVISMTRSAARELAAHRITVNCISPAARTEMFDTFVAAMPSDAAREAYLGRFLLGVPEPADIAGVFVFLASDAASHITGQVLNADGGLVI